MIVEIRLDTVSERRTLFQGSAFSLSLTFQGSKFRWRCAPRGRSPRRCLTGSVVTVPVRPALPAPTAADRESNTEERRPTKPRKTTESRRARTRWGRSESRSRGGLCRWWSYCCCLDYLQNQPLRTAQALQTPCHETQNYHTHTIHTRS